MLTRTYTDRDPNEGLIAYTPMFHSRLFSEAPKHRDHHFQPTKASLDSHPTNTSDEPPKDAHLDGNPSFDRPLFVQFCANSPDDLLDSARYVEPYCDAVDLNLGCPQGIAKRGNYGAFLQEDWNLIYRLINKLHLYLDIPVTAKLRILETKEKTLEYAKMILSAGASILTVHGRQRDQKGHNTGLADWDVIRYLRDHLPPETVIFANGNILHHDDIQRCLEKTGADAVMSAEGNLHDPTIFASPPPIGEEGLEYWRGRDGRGGFRVDAVFRRYLDIIYKYVLEKSPPRRTPLFQLSNQVEEAEPSTTLSTAAAAAVAEEGVAECPPPAKRQKHGKKKPGRSPSPSLGAMQPHLFSLLRPLITKHTHIRDALAKSRPEDMPAFEHVLRLTESAVKAGLKDYASDPAKYDELHNNPSSIKEEERAAVRANDITATNDGSSSAAVIRACKRPWWICQPYVRPLPSEALAKGSLTMSIKDKKKALQKEAEETREGKQLKTIVQRKAGVEVGKGHEVESEREKVDREDGIPEQEIPKEAMVCG